LQYNQNVDDFQAPFTEGTKTNSGQTILGTHHVDALAACQTACRHILDDFIYLDFDILYSLPVIFSVRVVYTIVVLIKLYVAATTPGEMEAIIKKDELRVEEYLNTLEGLFSKVMDRDPLSPGGKFLFVVQRLKERYANIKMGEKAVEKEVAAIKSGRAKGRKSAGNNPPAVPPGPNQGLQLLSEVAMGNNNSNRAPSAVPQAQQQHHPSQGQQWYPQPDMTPMPMDPTYAQYGGQPPVPFMGLENIDFGFGTSMGDADLSGLFMGDLNSPWWNMPTGDPNQPYGWPPQQ